MRDFLSLRTLLNTPAKKIKIFVRFIEIMRGQISLGKYLFPTQAAEKSFEQVRLVIRKGIKKVIRLLGK